MGVRRHYTCDLCNAQITDAAGIGVVHKANGDIQAAYLHSEAAGHHLCNSCVKGLRFMLADLDRTARTQDDLDRAAESAGAA